MEKKRSFPPNEGRGNSQQKAPSPETLPTASITKDHAARPARPGFKILDQGCERTKSEAAVPEETSPYTNNFFARLAKTVTNTFPFEKFAEENGCEVEDVVRAIKITIVAPLSKPSIQTRSRESPMKPFMMTQAAGSQEDGHKATAGVSTIGSRSVAPLSEPSSQSGSKLNPMETAESAKVTDPKKNDIGVIKQGASANGNKLINYSLEPSTSKEARVTLMQTVEATRCAKFTKEDGRKIGDDASADDNHVAFKLPELPRKTLKPSVLSETTKIENAIHSANEKGVVKSSITALTTDPPQLCPRSAKKRKTMAPIERQLIRQDVYGNYAPVESEKASIRIIYEK